MCLAEKTWPARNPAPSHCSSWTRLYTQQIANKRLRDAIAAFFCGSVVICRSIMLPASLFDPLLRAMSLESPVHADGYESHEVIAASQAIAAGRIFQESAIHVWYPRNAPISFERFGDRLRGELRNAGHKSADAVIGAILVLYLLHPQRIARPTALLNEFLSQIAPCELAQLFILAHQPVPGFQDFRIGAFSIGELRWRSLRNLSRNAGSDYFSRYKEELIGRFAIERDLTRGVAINWNALRPDYKNIFSDVRTAEQWNRGIEVYYGSLGVEYFEEFWGTFMNSQDLAIASGAPFLDQRQLRLTPFANPVTIFLATNGTWGFVSPQFNGGFVIDFAKVDRRIPRTLENLKNDFGLDANAPLAPPLKEYVHFVSKARRYFIDGLFDEAFLHYVIALELLFGERRGTTDAISSRVACLIFTPLKLALRDAEQRLNKIYDARSRYVHQGEAIDRGLLTDLTEVCDEVLWALLRRIRNGAVETDVIGRWTKDLDYLYSALIADKAISDDDLRAAGIDATSSFTPVQ